MAIQKTIDKTSNKISSNAISSSKIASNAVTTSKIANNAITAAKIAPGAITLELIDIFAEQEKYRDKQARRILD